MPISGPTPQGHGDGESVGISGDFGSGMSEGQSVWNFKKVGGAYA